MAGGSACAGGGSGEVPGERPQGTGEWPFLSYMIGGMILYGFVGWLAARWTGWPVLFPVGMLLGLASGIALIIFRVTRS
jgi:hypothetical protein